MTLNDLLAMAHDTARAKGFWENERNDGEMIALMHSELSEALEAVRKPHLVSEKLPGFTLLEEEMADLFIRAADFCEARWLRIEEAIKAKNLYNRSRPYKHGKLF